MKKRLTIILGAFTMGGAEHMVYELIQNVDTSHFDISVLCYMRKQDTLLAEQVEAKFPVTYLNQSGHITPNAIWKIVRAIQKTRPDVVHTHLGGTAFGAIWSMLFRKPLVITAHTKPEKAFTRKIEKLVRAALRIGRTKLVAVSAENAALIKEYYGVNETKCAFVNNGINVHRFFRRKHDAFTLINVARQDDNKNQAALIRCFARLREQTQNCKLLLLGDGINHQKLQKLAAELGIADAVEFTGNVVNTEDYYAVSDLYVQTSFREAMPLSVLEAMAAGLPIVSTDVGGLTDVVQDNGILIPAGDDDALYAAIDQIYNQDNEKTNAMNQASLRIVQDYSSEKMARAYEKVYNELCK